MFERRNNWLTYEKIAAVAEALIHRGENPTMHRVRQELGNIGSNTTINKYLNEWKTAKLKGNYNNTTAPANPPDPVNAAVSQVWQKLNEEAQTEIAAIKEQVNKEIELVRAEKELITIERDQAFKELEVLKQQLSELKIDNTSLMSNNREYVEQLHIANNKLADTEKSYDTFKQEKERQVQELTLQHSQTAALLKEQISDLNKAHYKEVDELRTLMEKHRHEWINEKDALHVKNIKLEKELQKSELQAQGYAGQLKDLEQQLKLNGNQLELCRLDNVKLAEQYNSLDKKAAMQEAELIVTKQQLEEKKAALEKALRDTQKEHEGFMRLEARLQEMIGLQFSKTKEPGMV